MFHSSRYIPFINTRPLANRRRLRRRLQPPVSFDDTPLSMGKLSVQAADMENDEAVNHDISKIPNFSIKVSHDAKLRELLRNITSIDLQLCSEASKEFMKLLRGDEGGEMLRQYVQTSPSCSELLQAWNLRQSKPGLSYIMSLINVILSHRDGVYKPNDVARIPISRALDKFARLILEQKLGDVYKELNGKDGKGKTASLLLMASIVRRGCGLASDVAKSFDFKLPNFLKLAQCDKRRRNVEKIIRTSLTRRSYVRFAMSFLEIGDSRLLRWVLQQKEMFSGVLRGLGSDEEETVVHVLSILRDKVLVPESLVPVGLRSVLFGSVTLEQLVNISGRDDGGDATKMAQKVLYIVCTDPSNGLMPDAKASPFPLKGNPTRLLGVMKKLKATEIVFHRDLLLAIVRGRPSFGSAYLDEFPYNLEDHATWFAAVSLAANLISSVNAGLSVDFLDSQPQEPPSVNSSEVQSIMKCIAPRSFNRIVINKGLLHSESQIQHGTLRLVLEALTLLDFLFSALSHKSEIIKKNECQWASLKQDIQNEVQLLLPDHQVLLSLISSLNSRYKSEERTLKRGPDATVLPEHRASRKKLKTHSSNEESDILVIGISSLDTATPGDNAIVQEEDEAKDSDNQEGGSSLITELWGSHEINNHNMAAEDEESYFYSKLLDALKIYHRTMPSVLEGSFDFFKVLPSNALSLPTILQRSMLLLLIEHIDQSCKQDNPIRYPPMMYKHLMHFINLAVNSPVQDIKDQAYVLARAAMLSSGAFDNNAREIDAWFLFLPGFGTKSTKEREVETVQNLSSVVISFFCDAVSTIGNNLLKYWDLLRFQIQQLETTKGVSPRFSPLFVCVLEKCLRLLGSESGTFNLPEKSMVSLYVSNTLRYLLQTQVEAGLLSSLICLSLSDRLENVDGDFCEWRPLKSLLRFSRSIKDQESCMLSLIDTKTACDGGSFVNLLCEVMTLVESEHESGMATAFSSSMLCAAPEIIMQHFPEVISISQNLNGVPFSILLSICFLESGFLNFICKSWPESSFSGLERAVSAVHDQDWDHGTMDLRNSSEAFTYFLRHAPFYVLFPAIMSVECLYLSKSSELQDLLLAKLSKEMPDNFVCSLRLVLFWFQRMHFSYRNEPSKEHVTISEICLALIKSMPVHLPSGNHGSGSKHYAQEIAETIFCHPAVIGAVETPLSVNKELKGDIFRHPTDEFLCLARGGVHVMDHHVLQVLEHFCNHLFSSNKEKVPVDFGHANKPINRVFKGLLQKLIHMLKDRFNQFIDSKNLLPLIPPSFALLTLIRFISPQELLELVNWTFSRINLNDYSAIKSSELSALALGLNIGGCAFDLLLHYIQQPYVHKVPFCFSGIQEFDVALFERVYFHVVGIASHSKLVVADLCFLKTVELATTHSGSAPQSLPQCMIMSRIVESTPIDFISKCFRRTSMITARILFHLTESSLLHLSYFGLCFIEMVDKSLVIKERKTRTCDEGFIMLLPTALSFIQYIDTRYVEKCWNHLARIRRFYWEMLFDGFSNWKSFVSQDLFQVNIDASALSTMEELCELVHGSLLGRAVIIMQQHLVASSKTVKRSKRLKLFDSVLPSGADNILDCDILEIDHYSVNQSSSLIIKAVTKILLCKILLFPNGNIQVLGKGEDVVGEMIQVSSLEVMSKREYSRSVLFVNALVSTWRLIVKRFPSKSSSGSQEGKKCAMFRLLEILILRVFIEVTAEMHKSSKAKSGSLINLEQLARFCLLHRFEDPATLRMLRAVLTFEAEDKSLHIQILQLLLSHSQFAPTIQSASKSSNSLQFGIIFRPMSSILRSLAFSSMDHNAPDKSILSEMYMKQLEIIKLLRVLCRSRDKLGNLGFEQDIGIDTRELMFLLLSSYGATLDEKDLKIYKLMHELENVDELNSSYIADLDYLWGIAAIKARKVRETEQALSSDDMDDAEAVEKHRKSQFRENLPIDPRMCAATVLHFPYYRNTTREDNGGPASEAQMADSMKRQVYDPVFILCMSMHGLSMDYIDPVEYASLGLLAVTFVSLSSPDMEIRKLGYKVLAVFRNALETSQKRKDVNRLRPLLTYVQNGISEPWQRIPSVHALFAAEASILLLDPSNGHYKTISKLLVQSPMYTKMISFFDQFFWSNSANFKSDRIWILRLLYCGQNLEDDAQIYVRSSILEKLLSFYSSSLSDNESKELILRIVKKSIKFDKTSRYLIEHRGVISWLSTLISNFCGRTFPEQRSVLLGQLTLILEVVNVVVSSKNTTQWLETRAVEQLTQLASHLYSLFADNFELVKEIHMVDMILRVLVSTLEISQKRDEFQPHFTFSVEGLYQLSEAINICCNGEYNPSAVLGLKVVLMSTPQAAIFTTDHEKLQKFVFWAVSIALKAYSSISLQTEESDYNIQSCVENERMNDSLLSKLLRWLTASVILGRRSWQLRDEESENSSGNFFPETLQSFLEAKWAVCRVSRAESGSEELLAAIIYYLHQILGRKCEVLSSVVGSLCLLLSIGLPDAGSDALPCGGSTLTASLSSIRCPVEANPSWKWSFEQPRKDPSTDISCVDEFQACQSILLTVSNILGKKSSLMHSISYLDVEDSGVLKWEKSLIESE